MCFRFPSTVHPHPPEPQLGRKPQKPRDLQPGKFENENVIDEHTTKCVAHESNLDEEPSQHELEEVLDLADETEDQKHIFVSELKVMHDGKIDMPENDNNWAKNRPLQLLL